ncbi:winged helix-turn-helix domain-containing protein [Constrictibacter sp. MBR-5]|uniref:winged helix-turn-helix domain-containing protein n=1 Tax=Constrictibacter sp. MBR-5 TaxID=3156467 RepID=UPI0033968B1A
MRELRARISSILRRTRAPSRLEPQPDKNRRVRMGLAWLDLDSHRLHCDDGSELKLTTMEFDLLNAFASHPNRVLTRDQLLDLAHNRQWEPFDRSIDIRITRIRRKIEPDPAKPQVIKTVRGSGYIFVTEQ